MNVIKENLVAGLPLRDMADRKICIRLRDESTYKKIMKVCRINNILTFEDEEEMMNDLNLEMYCIEVTTFYRNRKRQYTILLNTEDNFKSIKYIIIDYNELFRRTKK